MLRLENGARFVAAVAFVAALALAVPPGMADDAPLNLQGGSAKPMAPSRSATLPRIGSICSDGSSASSWAFRRADAVPMRIPGRTDAAPTSASRGSSRSR